MWPEGQNLLDSQEAFKRLCGLPAVVGAIDGTNVHIAKPTHGPEDYFCFKSGGYTMNCQAVVDTKKRFLDLFLSMPGSTHDTRVLRRSSLYRLGMYNNLFDACYSMEGFSPYLIGDIGYPLLPWLMVPHKRLRNCTMLESLFNEKLRKRRCVVDNAFGILKQSLRELLVKSELRVTFIPNVILCCAILHNILMGQSHTEVKQLLEMLRDEGLHGEVLDGDIPPVDANLDAEAPEVVIEGAQFRTDLALYLGAKQGM